MTGEQTPKFNEVFYCIFNTIVAYFSSLHSSIEPGSANYDDNSNLDFSIIQDENDKSLFKLDPCSLFDPDSVMKAKIFKHASELFNSQDNPDCTIPLNNLLYDMLYAYKLSNFVLKKHFHGISTKLKPLDLSKLKQFVIQDLQKQFNLTFTEDELQKTLTHFFSEPFLNRVYRKAYVFNQSYQLTGKLPAEADCLFSVNFINFLSEKKLDSIQELEKNVDALLDLVKQKSLTKTDLVTDTPNAPSDLREDKEEQKTSTKTSKPKDKKTKPRQPFNQTKKQLKSFWGQFLSFVQKPFLNVGQKFKFKSRKKETKSPCDIKLLQEKIKGNRSSYEVVNFALSKKGMVQLSKLGGTQEETRTISSLANRYVLAILACEDCKKEQARADILRALLPIITLEGSAKDKAEKICSETPPLAFTR